jgi:hypothetical protein
VGWRLRIDISDNYRAIIFLYELRGNLSGNDAAKKAIWF